MTVQIKSAGPKRTLRYVLPLLLLGSLCGCQTTGYTTELIPASKVPCDLRGPVRGRCTPYPLTSLGQDKPAAHIVDAGDKLSVYVYGVIPSSRDESPVIQRTQPVNQRYYPPNGSVSGATIGLPMEVDPNGLLDLPLIGQINVAGMTLSSVTETIKRLYREKQVVQEGSERVQVSLITPRVRRIVVIREDTPSPNVALLQPGQVDHIHRGSAEVVDLPIYENDILHALAATGGLPGTDAAREIWVFKRKGLTNPHAVCLEELRVQTIGFVHMDESAQQVVNVPLVGCPGQPVPYSASNVILDEGDVVYLPRRDEYFYTGGLIGGAKIPLPRDKDVDIIEAISLAQGSVGGPLGKSGLALTAGTPGHMVAPTQATIIRKLPDGRQFSILVDIERALADPAERIRILPDDLVMFQFKKHEAVTNGIMNWLNLNVGAGTTF